MSPDENLTFGSGPSYYLVIFASSVFINACLWSWWIVNCLRLWTVNRKNALYNSLTGIFTIGLVIQSFGLGATIWIESLDYNDDNFVSAYASFDTFTFAKLIYISFLYMILILVSRGWCITKNSNALTHLDRQLIFLLAIGVTFANILSANYSNRLAVGALLFVYIIYCRIIVLSTNEIMRQLDREITSLESRRIRIPDVLIQSIKLKKKTLIWFKTLVCLFFFILFASRIVSFFTTPVWIAGMEMKRPTPCIRVGFINGNLSFSSTEQETSICLNSDRMDSLVEKKSYFILPPSSVFSGVQLATICPKM